VRLVINFYLPIIMIRSIIFLDSIVISKSRQKRIAILLERTALNSKQYIL